MACGRDPPLNMQPAQYSTFCIGTWFLSHFMYNPSENRKNPENDRNFGQNGHCEEVDENFRQLAKFFLHNPKAERE